MQSRFDYAEYWVQLTLKGREKYGEQFQLREDDAPVIARMICWVLKDEPVAKKMDIEIHKGIFLNGPVGAGKTSLMHLLNYLMEASQVHAMRSCRDISFEFSADGYEVIARYAKKSFRAHSYEPKAYCFDDLGLECSAMHFGSHCQVMGEILLSRYDLFVNYGMITHVTTNLNSQDVEEVYGKRVRSRLRQMLNLITFPGDTPDKRR
ncbi:ATPase [Chitinophaga sp. XS-30]|nr:ATPase [Chitinophaga sp. XS-30]